MFLGFLIDRHHCGIREMGTTDSHPSKSRGKGPQKMQAALAPGTHKDSVRTRILGLNSIIGGWCRYYQMTSSPRYYFDKLEDELFKGMAHWLGRKYELSTPQVMKRIPKGSHLRNRTHHAGQAREFKAKRHGSERSLTRTRRRSGLNGRI